MQIHTGFTNDYSSDYKRRSGNYSLFVEGIIGHRLALATTEPRMEGGSEQSDLLICQSRFHANSKGLLTYLHSFVEKIAQFLETAIFLLFVLQPGLRLFNRRRVDVDERLCFGKRPHHKSSQPEDIKNKAGH